MAFNGSGLHPGNPGESAPVESLSTSRDNFGGDKDADAMATENAWDSGCDNDAPRSRLAT